MPLDNFGSVATLLDAAGDVVRLYRGAQPDVQGFRDLALLHVDLVLALNGSADDAWIAARPNGLRRTEPMSSFAVDDAQVRRIADELAGDLRLGRTVFVHCTHGRDRTGLVVAAWRILHQGWPFEAADAERQLYGNALVLEVADHLMVECLRRLAGTMMGGGVA